MIRSSTIRGLIVAAAVGLALLPTTPLRAQRGGPGGGPGGPGGPGPMGGGPGFGVPRNSFMGDRGPLPTAPPRTGPQLGLPGRWWDDGHVAKKLKLRGDQRQHMDDIFDANRLTLQGLYNNWQREEARLSSLSPRELQDETKVDAAIDRVAAARAELEKQNAHVLMLIRQQLDSAQLAKLDSEIASAH